MNSASGTLNNLAMLPAMSLSQALAAFVGQNMGASKTGRVKAGMKSTLLMSSLISICITLLVVMFRSGLMRLFSDNPEVIKVGTEYLVIVGSFYLFFSTMFTFNGVMRGAGDTLVPMFLSLISLWVIRIPLAVFLSGLIGTNGIWWSAPASWFTGMLFSFLYYLTGKWKLKVIVKKPEDTNLSISTPRI